MKKLMILGAGIYQVPLIKKAKEMGIFTIAVSIPGRYPGFALADRVYYENTVDSEAVLELARKEQIDGILTAGTDVAVITIGKVCDALHLPGVSFEAARIATDKIRMKERYEACGVRTARFRTVSFDGAEAAAAQLQYPLIFKAVDSSGSRGIIRVNKKEECPAAIAYVKENTRNDHFLIEEFLEGEEFGAQAFVQDGEVKFILPHGDYVFHGETGVPVGHFAPYEMQPSALEDMKTQLRLAVRAMKLNNCAINADFILKDGKTYVLELGARSGATCLAELVSIYYGFDYYEKMIRAALGETVTFPQDQAVPNASMLLRSARDGVVRAIHSKAAPGGNLCEVQFDCQVGDPVHAFRVGPHRIGHVIAKGKTLQEAVDTLQEALGKIEIIVEETS